MSRIRRRRRQRATSALLQQRCRERERNAVDANRKSTAANGGKRQQNSLAARAESRMADLLKLHLILLNLGSVDVDLGRCECRVGHKIKVRVTAPHKQRCVNTRSPQVHERRASGKDLSPPLLRPEKKSGTVLNHWLATPACQLAR